LTRRAVPEPPPAPLAAIYSGAHGLVNPDDLDELVRTAESLRRPIG
jgi:hypothetical protein